MMPLRFREDISTKGSGVPLVRSGKSFQFLQRGADPVCEVTCKLHGLRVARWSKKVAIGEEDDMSSQLVEPIRAAWAEFVVARCCTCSHSGKCSLEPQDQLACS